MRIDAEAEDDDPNPRCRKVNALLINGVLLLPLMMMDDTEMMTMTMMIYRESPLDSVSSASLHSLNIFVTLNSLGCRLFVT